MNPVRDSGFSGHRTERENWSDNQHHPEYMGRGALPTNNGNFYLL